MEKLGIFVRSNVSGMGEVLDELEGICHDHGVGVCFEEGNAYGKRGVSLEEIQRQSQMLLSLGGDGTLISTFHKIPSLPIAGINAGNLGFLTGVCLEKCFEFLPLLFGGEYEVHRPLTLSVYYNEEKIARSLNEVLICKKDFSTMIEIEAMIGGKMLNHYYCDGLIIATPTGSTAYNISAGGSVVYPYCQNILLTPLAPHSLTQRPMIVGSDAFLEFETRQDSQIIVDGQKIFDFPHGARLKICNEGESACLIYPRDWDYFALLREKFRWGD
ncbi:NAD(+)/NADH kinase [Helicobacter pametensis]|uniref:NAD(+)/NADH kinase n=1 Tax=Helicobacter pametensis TaxID=95149 RepID=UPI0004B46CE8|nr:NAD(+)/NADH kinase [Helicobacter pametensis]